MTGQSQEEIFDVVNERDEVVGQATRREVHARRLWHRAVHVLVFATNGDILLQKRSMLKDTYPGTWTTSCAGHVDQGESYLDCGLRELGEELGIEVSQENLLEMRRFSPSAQTGWEWVVLYQTTHDGPFLPSEAEVSELMWKTPAALDEWMERAPKDFAPSFIHVWRSR